ncbi:hypothetical protein SLEP1_g25983 [Rubroshorea leprosula]|uniref:Uncharacterized protein n=1 Tax=Rubroshorea leprosula TaxID=152421 RepID=A0AAV5JRX9_9ROSI|nr:hypothetical protein SLEP1_g25983 [Rubroshorea leprosula]
MNQPCTRTPLCTPLATPSSAADSTPLFCNPLCPCCTTDPSPPYLTPLLVAADSTLFSCTPLLPPTCCKTDMDPPLCTAPPLQPDPAPPFLHRPFSTKIDPAPHVAAN